MLAFGSYSTPMATTQDEDYSLYTFSGMTTQAPSYSTIYLPIQQSVTSGFDPYTIQQDHIPNPPTNYVLESQNSRPKSSKSNIQLCSPLYSPTAPVANYFDLQPSLRPRKSESTASVHSSLSSATGSPLLTSNWTPFHGVASPVVKSEHFRQQAYAHDNFNYDALTLPEKSGCVDPTLIQPLSPTPPATQSFAELSTARSPKRLFPHPPSPAPSAKSNKSQNASGVVRTSSTRAASPYLPSQSWNPYPPSPSRRQSVASSHSQRSRRSQSSLESEENKGICPIASCGRQIKDLKAHLLTHKNERPEKCPISSCEYHIKGFARKYDKNRHTLTHYKGTMVCGFCPGSGSSQEKSFNRADVFKRHLTSIHGVEQTAPNSRRKSGGSSGKGAYNKLGSTGICSTCSVSFSNVQDFYEHLDDCVLRVIQQGDPCEAINERILTSMVDDKAVKETLERHSLSIGLDLSGPTSFDDDEEDEEDEKDIKNARKRLSGDLISPIGAATKNNGSHQGMTYSKGGVPLHANGKGNKRRKNYPPCWNAPPEKIKTRKRVLCVFDGPRRLWKDDMMLGIDNHVREPLPGGDGRNWITNFDVQTLRRAEGILEATEEEKGPWMYEQGNPLIFSD